VTEPEPAATEPSARRNRRGEPLAPGDLVQLTDPKHRHHTFPLRPGAAFFSHKGSLAHDDIIGRPEGIVLTSTGGTPYLVLRPMLADFVLSMKRGATIVYPKDAAAVVSLADLFPGARVAEAGVGSGALACTLLQAVGEHGYLSSYELRPDFADIARTNVERWLGGPHPAWRLTVGDVAEHLADEERLDAVVLDLLAPWDVADAARRALVPGGVLVAYVATTTQLSLLVETLRAADGWTEPKASEQLVRTWHVEGLAVRPDHRMVAHTGFLVAARRLADGQSTLLLRRRPAKGAYGEDYRGPRGRHAAPPPGDEG
jgi:tRNA (adenine57-N1/adenine58-N1)-methyltransferase